MIIYHIDQSPMQLSKLRKMHVYQLDYWQGVLYLTFIVIKYLCILTGRPKHFFKVTPPAIKVAISGF